MPSTVLNQLIEYPAGNYKVLPSGAAYCSGIIPDPGYEVVRVEVNPWLALDEAYAFIENHLKEVGRPVHAFCGIELRVPQALTFDKWSSFNVPYLAQLRKWGLMHGDFSGVCRSNIALDIHPPAVTSMCAFSYVAAATSTAPTFLLSGQADIGPGNKIIAEGSVDFQAMQTRTRFTIDTVSDTLRKLGFSWEDTTRIALFHVHEIPDLWGSTLLGVVGEPIRRGVLVYRARPPIAGGEVELEARAIRQEWVIATA